MGVQIVIPPAPMFYMQTFQERPSYPLIALIADIGGILGLYLGITFVSFVELFELLINLLLYGRYMTMKGDKKQNSNNGGGPRELHLVLIRHFM